MINNAFWNYAWKFIKADIKNNIKQELIRNDT